MKTKTKNLILILLVAIIASLIPALLFGKWLEAIIFLICHTLIRPQYPRQYHNIISAICRTISAYVLFFGISFTLPLELSLFSAIPINYFISWVGFTKAEADYYEVQCQGLKLEINELITQLENPKDKLLRQCAKAKLSARDTEIAVKYYVERMSAKDIWLWLCSQKFYEQIEWDSVHQVLWRIGKKLKNVGDL